MKKKLVASVLAAAMVLPLAACGNNGGAIAQARVLRAARWRHPPQAANPLQVGEPEQRPQKHIFL